MSMHRQVLRSRSGCNRCKLRRKKCDERKPVCSPCQRLDLICTWGTEAQTESAQHGGQALSSEDFGTIQRSAIRRLPLSKNVSSGMLAFQNQTQFDLTVSFPGVFKATLAPTASAEYQDLSMFVSVALRNEGVRNALSAMSGAMLFMESEESVFGQASLENYQRAVVMLRRSISEGLEGRDPTELYIMANALGMVEACGLGNAQLAAYHFAASARFWSRTVPEALTHETSKAICRCCAETWLWFLGTLLMFLTRTEIDQIVSCIDWSALKIAFQSPSVPPMPAWTQSPHLAVDHSLFRLVIQVTQFSRQNHVESQRQQQLALWFSEIESIESEADTAFVGLQTSIANTYRALSRVYVHTLRIFLLKLSLPGICSSHRQVSSSFALAVQDLDNLGLGNCEVQMCYWPFFMLLCSAREKQTFESLVTRAHTSRLDTGSIRMVDRMIKVVRGLRKKDPCSGQSHCSGGHDGLDLLLAEDGFSTFEGADGSLIHQSLGIPEYKPFVVGLWRLMRSSR